MTPSSTNCIGTMELDRNRLALDAGRMIAWISLCDVLTALILPIDVQDVSAASTQTNPYIAYK